MTGARIFKKLSIDHTPRSSGSTAMQRVLGGFYMMAVLLTPSGGDVSNVPFINYLDGPLLQIETLSRREGSNVSNLVCVLT